jgi:hypothetical protein
MANQLQDANSFGVALCKHFGIDPKYVTAFEISGDANLPSPLKVTLHCFAPRETLEALAELPTVCDVKIDGNSFEAKEIKPDVLLVRPEWAETARKIIGAEHA